MARRLPSLNALKAFEAAARHEGFTDAAGELFVTHAAISRHIRELEEWLGTQLFVRTGRGVELTDAGRHFGQRLTPLFDAMALEAQARLWSLQGMRRSWFCGAYFGSGFHEDGLQAGLAVAEILGGVRRPWRVPDESGRIPLSLGLERAA